MWNRLLFIVSVFFTVSAVAINFPPQSKQLIVVTVKSPTSIHARVQRYQRKTLTAKWVQVGKFFPAVIGKNGATANRREGDDKTPLGLFPIWTAFGIWQPAGHAVKMPYIHVAPDTLCVDDPSSAFYNRIVDGNQIVNSDWNSAEHMHHYLTDYHFGLVVDYNRNPAIAGKGSCIFIHVWNGPNAPTAGCIAMAKKNMRQILTWLRPQAKPFVTITI